MQILESLLGAIICSFHSVEQREELGGFTAEVNTQRNREPGREKIKCTCTSFHSAASAYCIAENIYVAQQPTLSWALGTVCTGIGRHCNWGMMGAGRLAGGNIPARQAWALIRVRS